jgi:AcrR family transcriptional regulator
MDMSEPVGKAKVAPTVGRRDSRGDERRRTIFRALHDCIIEKGYVRTTLADVAQSADMSASHLLYYFDGKEDVLEQYFQNVAERFVLRLEEMRTLDTALRMEALADFWFHGESSTRQEIGFMLECFGAAVNDDVLRVTKSQFDMYCKDFLSNIFRESKVSLPPVPQDAAELAYAIMIGLRSAVYFDEDVDLARAHTLFLSTVQGMCVTGLSD